MSGFCLTSWVQAVRKRFLPGNDKMYFCSLVNVSSMPECSCDSCLLTIKKKPHKKLPYYLALSLTLNPYPFCQSCRNSSPPVRQLRILCSNLPLEIWHLYCHTYSALCQRWAEQVWLNLSQSSLIKPEVTNPYYSTTEVVTMKMIQRWSFYTELSRTCYDFNEKFIILDLLTSFLPVLSDLKCTPGWIGSCCGLSTQFQIGCIQ